MISLALLLVAFATIAAIVAILNAALRGKDTRLISTPGLRGRRASPPPFPGFTYRPGVAGQPSQFYDAHGNPLDPLLVLQLLNSSHHGSRHPTSADNSISADSFGFASLPSLSTTFDSSPSYDSSSGFSDSGSSSSFDSSPSSPDSGSSASCDSNSSSN